MSLNTFKIGYPAPDFNLLSVDGSKYSVQSFSGKKAVIIVFTCNHCPYAQAYENRIIQIQKDYSENLQVIAINSNDDSEYPDDSFENMKERAKNKSFNFPYLRDDTQEIAKAFDATHTPEIFLFNQERKLVFHGKIDDNWRDESKVKSMYLRDAVEELIQGKEISVPETFTIGCTIKWKP